MLLFKRLIITLSKLLPFSMPKKVSQKDIAIKLGVSTALVSYVLNNQKQDRINKTVAQKIRDTAAEMNYRKNQLASSLKTNKTFTIGLIIADISNPFSSNLARIIEDEADKYNYTVIFGSSDENVQKFEKLVDTFLTRQVDGLIISPPANAEPQIAYLQQQDLPFVIVDRIYPTITANTILLDNYSAAHEATELLLQKGYDRPAFITYRTGLYHIEERKRGYKEALQKHRVSFTKTRVKEVALNNVKEEIEKAVQAVLNLPEPVNAILFASSVIAEFAVKYINTLPLKVPQDLALICFDESTSLDLFYAPITYIKQPVREMGELATKMLVENIGNNNKISQVNMKGTLVRRASV